MVAGGTVSKNIRISKVLGPENVADAYTKPADKCSVEFFRPRMSVRKIAKQVRDAVLQQIQQSFCLCVIVHDHVCSTSLQVLQAKVLFLIDQQSGDQHYALFKLFYPTSFNPEHVFRDAHTVPFCLTTDHILTCLMLFSDFSRQHSFGLLGHVVNGSAASVLISDVGVEYRHGELVWTEGVWKPGSLHGVPWIAQLGHGVGGVSRQLATDAVVCSASQCLVMNTAECPGLSIK